jgi:DNA (cytosine-5)-methyltransferase 1
VLDAQYFNLAQRRERVFVVGCLGGWQRAAAVLFERASLRGDIAPSRQKGKNFTHELAPSIGASGRGFSRAGETRGQDPVIAQALQRGQRPDGESETFITHALRADGFDASEDGTGRGTPLTLAIRGRSGESTLEWRDDGLANAILTPNGGRAGIGVGAIAFNTRQDPISGPISGPLDTDGTTNAVAFAQNSRSEVREMPIAGAVAADVGVQQQTYVAQTTPTLLAGGNRTGGDRPPGTNIDTLIAQIMAVRRLTPRECERLQGFPDDYTLITYNKKPAKDGPRYKALGNSMAVPVMGWIGKRIELVNSLVNRKREVA